MSNQNPYSKAAGAYVTQATATDQRSLEGTVLLQSAQKLEDLMARLNGGEKIRLEEINGVLTHNRKLWELFVSDMANPDHALPQDIKNNIASLAFFVFKRTQEINIETQPEKFKALISINRSIAAGLMKRTTVSTPSAQKPSADAAGMDSLA
jgi:flagellar protein FlaF